jgi:hypothetical protein
MYPKIMLGTVETTPLKLTLNISTSYQCCALFATTSLSVKNTIATATHKYIEHITPSSEVNLNALTYLGTLIGNNMPNENTTAKNNCPVLSFLINFGI